MKLTEPTRAYIYRVTLVAQPLATAYGIIDEQKAVLWLALVAAVLSLGLASANTSRTAP